MGSGAYFAVDAAFWTDPDVVDNFTPEDKYFYLYLLTSPHGNVAGCFEISTKQMAAELGYSRDTVEHLIDRFVSVHRMIDYDKENKEILVHKWGRHHWTRSDKYLAAVQKKIAVIKTERFKSYLTAMYERYADGGDGDIVWIPYQYGIDTSFLSFNNNSLDIPLDKEEGDRGGVEEKGEPVVTLLLNDKAEYPVYQDYINQMQGLYPAVDVFCELRKMSAWCINNPDKRKTKRGITKFINSWLSREQDKGGSRGGYGNRSGGKSFLDMYREEYGDAAGRDSEVVVSY